MLGRPGDRDTSALAAMPAAPGPATTIQAVRNEARDADEREPGSESEPERER